MLERHTVASVLRRKLGEQCDIRVNKRINKIEETPQGVMVTSEDGEQTHGQLVVGCDGAHSIVRHAIWERANEYSPRLINNTEKQCELSKILQYESLSN